MGPPPNKTIPLVAVLLQKLDVITNDVLKRALRFTGKLGVLASEEEDAPVSLKNLFEVLTVSGTRSNLGCFQH